MSTAEYKGHHESHTPYAKGWLASMYLAVAINCVTLVLLNTKGYTGWGWAVFACNLVLVVGIAHVHFARATERRYREVEK